MSARRSIVIAIDGPAGAGKSSVARRVAERLGLERLDTGAMYRAVAWKALTEGVPTSDGRALASLARRIDLSFGPRGISIDGRLRERQIRSRRVSAAVSEVSSHPAVRRVMVARQRALARKGRVVVEGRDIGTVVAPNADLKIFLTASAAERARRRHSELARAGVGVSLRTLAAEVAARDRRDARTTPFVPARDAIIVDSTGNTLRRVVDEIVQHARSLEGPAAVRPVRRAARRGGEKR